MRALRFPLATSLAVVASLLLDASRYDGPPRTKTFLDRNGDVIGTLDPAYQGVQIWTPLPEIPESLQKRTIQEEDRWFHRHRGVNPVSILKAAWDNFLRGRVVRGGSTITQQLAKNLMQERACRGAIHCAPTPRSWINKLRESLLALGLEMKHTKAWILERYLNTVYYGRRSYGIAAAAETYFGKSLRELTTDEVDFLVARPKAPNRSPSPPSEARSFRIAGEGGRRPGEGRHFLEYASRFLTDDTPVIQTTLDLGLQTKLEAATARLLASRASDDPLLNAAVVVIDVKTGDLLALVGSRDYFNDEIAGQVNAAIALRQPGSTLKPFTYFAAFAKGFAPNSIVPDEPFSFQAVGAFGEWESDGYAPQNFDRRYHGAMTIREALANSYNIPAVVTLNEIGLSYYHDLLRQFGFTSLNRPPPHYGLSVTLGSGEVSLLELTNAYAALARSGMHLPYRFARHGQSPMPRLNRGRSCSPPKAPIECQKLAQLPVMTHAPQYAAMVTSILSDPEARLKAFGFNGDMTVEGHEVAVKTGTSFEHRDNWTVGYTPSFAIGVWVGHSDGSPMPLDENGLPATGASGAAPLWHAAMEAVLRGRPVERFPQPFPRQPPADRTVVIKQDKKHWKVISPVPHTTYRLSRFVPEEHQKIAGVADIDGDRPASLTWYLDDVYLEATEGTGRTAPVWMRPIPGKHVLRVFSSTGEKQEISFRVLENSL